MFNHEYDYRPNIGRHEVLVRSSPYPYNVNILFNIFTLSQEKSTESFRFCNNCAVLLVRSSSAGKECCFTISVDVHLLENIPHFSLQLPQKRDQKGTKVLRHFHKKNSPLFTYSGHLSPPPVYPHPLLPNQCCI